MSSSSSSLSRSLSRSSSQSSSVYCTSSSCCECDCSCRRGPSSTKEAAAVAKAEPPEPPPPPPPPQQQQEQQQQQQQQEQPQKGNEQERDIEQDQDESIQEGNQRPNFLIIRQQEKEEQEKESFASSSSPSSSTRQQRKRMNQRQGERGNPHNRRPNNKNNKSNTLVVVVPWVSWNDDDDDQNEWKRMERLFAYRTRVWQRISNAPYNVGGGGGGVAVTKQEQCGQKNDPNKNNNNNNHHNNKNKKNAWMYEYLWHRELQVRQQERQRFWLERVERGQHDNNNNDHNQQQQQQQRRRRSKHRASGIHPNTKAAAAAATKNKKSKKKRVLQHREDDLFWDAVMDPPPEPWPPANSAARGTGWVPHVRSSSFRRWSTTTTTPVSCPLWVWVVCLGFGNMLWYYQASILSSNLMEHGLPRGDDVSTRHLSWCWTTFLSTGGGCLVRVLVGCLLLRGGAGTFYWFTSPRMYDCAKFNIHNDWHLFPCIRTTRTIVRTNANAATRVPQSSSWSFGLGSWCFSFVVGALAHGLAMVRKRPVLSTLAFFIGHGLVAEQLRILNDQLYISMFVVAGREEWQVTTGFILLYDFVVTVLALTVLTQRGFRVR